MDDSQLNIVIQAEDQASSALTSVSSEMDNMSASAAGTSGATDELTASSTSAAAASDGLSSSLVQQVAVYASVGAGIAAFTGFMREAVGAASDEQTNLAILNQTLLNLGIQHENANGQIQTFLESQTQLGYSLSETSGIMTDLVLKTGNVTEAMAIMALGEDVAKAKHESLSQATTELAGILAGKGRQAMMDFAIQNEKGMTQADLFSKIIEKVGGDVAATSNTTETEGQRMSAAWQDFTARTGAALLPLISNIEDGMTGVIKVVESAGQALGGVADAFGTIAKVAIDFAEGNFSQAKTDIVAGGKEMDAAFKGAGDTFTAAFNPMADGVKAVTDANNALIDSLKNVQGSMGTDNPDATDPVAKAMQALQDVFDTTTAAMTKDNQDFIDESTNDYTDFVSKMQDITAQEQQLFNDHEDKLTQIKQDAADKRAAITADEVKTELTAYEKYQKDLTTLPEQIAQAQKKFGDDSVKGGDPTLIAADKAKLDDLTNQLAMAKKAIADHPELAAPAAKDQSTDDITKAQQAAATKLATEQKTADQQLDAANDSYAKQQAALIKHGNDEVDFYDKQKDKLLAKITDTYDKLADAVSKGLDKIDAVKGLSGSQRAAYETAAGGILGGLNAGLASSSGAVASPSSASTAQPITVNVMSGAIVNASTKDGLDALTKQINEAVTTALAKVLQNTRLGMASHN